MEAVRAICAYTWVLFSFFTLFAALTSVQAQLPLYPYGISNGDNEAGLGTPHKIDIPFNLRYYGQTFVETFITTDGILAFHQNVRYSPVADWRNGVPNLAIDLPFIAPFHYQGHVPNDPATYPGKIYYKVTERRADDANPFMDELDDYMNRAVVGVENFRSKFVLMVTWENVTSQSCTQDDCPSNTFQLVLIANEEQTFAIINYYKMEIPFNEHHLAGLNGGYRRGWSDVIPCDAECVKRNKPAKSRLTELILSSGSDIQGRYINEVDGDAIVHGGCLPAGMKAGQIEVFPRQTGMFGGQMLSVSGECYPRGTPIFCRFGRDDNLVSQGVMETEMKGRCPVPILTTRGEVTLEMSDTRGFWKHSTIMTIILPARLDRQITVSSEQLQQWYSRNPSGRLTAKWRPSDFTSKPDATVDISLIGYRETGDSLEWKELTKVGTDIMNADGQYDFDHAQYRCQSDCERFEIGMMQIRLNDQHIDNRTKYQAINIGPVALGWYVESAMTSKYGLDWPVAKCEAWDNQDSQSTSWLNHLLPCPCTLTQALADWGRWQPDMGCNMFTGSVCTYHVGAKHCVRSVYPSRDGAGNQCCYEENGLLRYAADTFEGSTPDRSHDWGATPYNTPGRVPSLSHWIHDVITFYYCCLWTEPVKNAVCKHYMDRRATRDCVAYVPPAAATVYGDPHITTFDGKTYYFGGAGDFWLLKSDVLNVQGKFEEAENDVLQLENTQLKPTVLKSVVMWKTGSDVVTVSQAPLNGPADRKLDITVSSERRFFEEKGLTWQDFNGVSIVNNAGSATSDEDTKHSNFTVLFSGGAGVQIAERQGLLHVITVLPPKSDQSATQTKGLLGTWDDDVSNDFTTPTSETVPIDAPASDVYSRFALLWEASKEDSRFQFPTAAQKTKSPFFGDPKSVPYRADQTRPSEQLVTSVCDESEACARDYYMTNDANIARASKRTDETFQHLQSSHTMIETCGLLDIPMAHKSNTNYSLGSVVTVANCRPQNSPVVGSGPLTYNCSVTQPGGAPQWSPSPDPKLCGFHEERSADKASDTGMIIGIVVACVVVAIIIIVVVVIVMKRRSSGGKSLVAI